MARLKVYVLQRRNRVLCHADGGKHPLTRVLQNVRDETGRSGHLCGWTEMGTSPALGTE